MLTDTGGCRLYDVGSDNYEDINQASVSTDQTIYVSSRLQNCKNNPS